MTSDAVTAGHGVALRRQKVAALVADAILADILDGDLEAGAVLPSEADMMRQFDVGRGTLREALRLLEAEGLVRVRPGRRGGPVVQAPPADRLARPLSIALSVRGSSFVTVVEARRLVEPALARLAAARATDEERARISSSVEELSGAVGEEKTFLALNRSFHTLIADAARSPALAAFWHAVESISDGHEAGIRYDEKQQAAILRMHGRIAQAIAEHDADRSATDMERHIQELLGHLEVHYPRFLEERVRAIDLHSP